jgi:enoyl-CoA hydratase/carnithine racemase
MIATVRRPGQGVGVVTLDLSEWAGFMSWAAVNALADALADARTGGARVTVLAAVSGDNWYQHAWLPDLIATATGGTPSGDPQGWWRALAEIAHPEVVTIAAISGDCSGGGAELGWACDLRVAEEQAWFGQPEVAMGLTTGIGGTSRLARLIGRTAAAELVFDGTPMTARRVFDLGGLNRCVPRGEAVDTAVAWAARLAERPASALAALKQILNDSDDLTLADALANEQRIFGGTLFSEEGIAGMRRSQQRYDAGETTRTVFGAPRGEDVR